MRKSVVQRYRFPIRGVHLGMAFGDQPRDTTVDARNVRTFDTRADRARGGQRPGLTKFLSTQLNSTADIQDIIHVTTIQSPTESQSQMQIRTISGFAVAGGTIKKFTGSAWATVTNGSSALLSTAPVVFSCEHYGDVYYADGTNAEYVDVSANTRSDWEAALTGGSFPKNGSDYPRLIEQWNGRIVLSGIKTDPQNIFMSKMGDALDFDYAPSAPSEIQAVALGTSLGAKLGDKVTAMIPYSNDVLIIGGDHHIYMLSGDPAAGGRFDLISDTIGMAFGRPWCKDPYGRVYFWGTYGGVYRMVPGQLPERLSSPRLDDYTNGIDLDTHIIRMAWRDEEQGVYVFVTPLTDKKTQNLFYDTRADAWWLDEFDDVDFYPRSVHVFDGDDPDDRRVLLGGKDGYLRYIDNNAYDDDDTAIDAYFFMGPFTSRDPVQPCQLKELQLQTAAFSDDVAYEIYVGDTAEDALTQTTIDHVVDLVDNEGDTIAINTADESLVTGEFTESPRSLTHHVRTTGYAHYIRLYNNTAGERFQVENLQVVISQITSSRARRLLT